MCVGGCVYSDASLGTLNSFSCTLMCINFLQICVPPVLPCLQNYNNINNNNNNNNDSSLVCLYGNKMLRCNPIDGDLLNWYNMDKQQKCYIHDIQVSYINM